MIQHITPEDIFRFAIRTIETGTDEHFVEFSRTLQSWTDRFRDFISAFRALHYVRARLNILQFPDNDRILRLQILTSYIDTELDLLPRYGNRNTPHETRFRWTGSLVALVEVIYGLDELHCINDGEVPINELFMFFEGLFGMDMKESHCYNAYADMKRRKNDSRTYFLDKMRERLNLRMQRDDEKKHERRR